jgi:hypothetical protein
MSEFAQRAIYFLRIGMTAWASVSLAALASEKTGLDLKPVQAAMDAGDFVYAADLLEVQCASSS